MSTEEQEFSAEEYERYDEAKTAALERVLGPMHDMVGHALIPFSAGGTVDMYYFPNGIRGTGFATMELIEPDGSGPLPNDVGTYELVAYTRHNIRDADEKADDDPFNTIANRITSIFTIIGLYSREAVLRPGETCEIPGEDGEPNTCLIFDEYAPDGKTFEIDGKRHCLLLCIELHRKEMKYAMKNSGAALLDKLKQAGHYPYSDMDRKPVVRGLFGL